MLRNLNTANWELQHAQFDIITNKHVWESRVKEAEETVRKELFLPTSIRILELGSWKTLLGDKTGAYWSPHPKTRAFWEPIKYSYCNAYDAIIAALCTFRQLKLCKDIVSLICQGWVWPSRFSPEVWYKSSIEQNRRN